MELIALETPGLAEANAAVSMPVCLHEAKTDLTAYLERYETGVDITQVVAAIASPDVKGLFDGMIMPVTLPGPDGAPTPMTPLYEAALATHRDALIAAYRTPSPAIAWTRCCSPRCPCCRSRPTRGPAASSTSCA